MTTLQSIALACVVSLLLGLGSGWYIHGKFDQAALTKEMQAQIDLANKRADDRVADEKKAKEDAEAKLAGMQHDTAALNSQLIQLRADNASLNGQIANVTFHPTSRPVPVLPSGQPTDRCPGHAVSSPEFVRLYRAAAQGTTASGAGTAPGSG